MSSPIGEPEISYPKHEENVMQTSRTISNDNADIHAYATFKSPHENPIKQICTNCCKKEIKLKFNA
jgi:hypothetical protein